MSLDTIHSSMLKQKTRVQTTQMEDITSTTGTGGWFTRNDFRYSGPETEYNRGAPVLINVGFGFKKNNVSLSMQVGGDFSNASGFIKLDYEDFVNDLYQPAINEAINSPEVGVFPPIIYRPGGDISFGNIKGRLETVKQYLSDNKVPTNSRDFYEWAEDGANQVRDKYYEDDHTPYDSDNFLHDVAVFCSSTTCEKLPDRALQVFTEYEDTPNDPDTFLSQANSTELFEASLCFPFNLKSKRQLITQAWTNKCVE